MEFDAFVLLYCYESGDNEEVAHIAYKNKGTLYKAFGIRGTVVEITQRKTNYFTIDLSSPKGKSSHLMREGAPSSHKYHPLRKEGAATQRKKNNNLRREGATGLKGKE